MDNPSLLHNITSLLDVPGSFFGYIPPFLVVITILVFVHELGHYIVGRFFKIGVEVFSVGFGREIFGWNDRRGTRWRLSWIPIGGYVRFVGEEGEKKKSIAADKGLAYDDISAWKRILVLFAGPAANLIFAIFTILLVFVIVGQAYLLPRVGDVTVDKPAYQAGIQTGDTILSIDGQKIESFSDIIEGIRDKASQMVDIGIRAEDGTIRHVRLKTDSHIKENGEAVGRLGISSSSVAFQSVSVAKAAGKAIDYTVDTSLLIIHTLDEILKGQRSSKELGGPIRIAEFSKQAWKEGGIGSLVMLIALISINLAMVNLFPLPPLDGGGIVLCTYEMIFGKKYLAPIKSLLYRLGTFLLLALIVFITWNDIARIING